MYQNDKNKFEKITQKENLGAKGVKSIQIALVKQGFAGKCKIMTFSQFIFRNNAILRIANSILDHFYNSACQNGIGALSTMSEFSTQLQKKL